MLTQLVVNILDRNIDLCLNVPTQLLLLCLVTVLPRVHRVVVFVIIILLLILCVILIR